MFKQTALCRLACGRTATLMAAAKMVPVGQPSPHDTTWYSRNPHIGAVKGTPSLEQMATENTYSAMAKDLERQQLKAAVEASLKRNAAADKDDGSSSTASTFTKVNLTDDYREAAKADHEDLISKAKVHVVGSEGAASTISTPEEAKQYVSQLDLSAMPNIPGMDKAELALKLLEFEKIKAQQTAQQLSGERERNNRLNQIEMMRMTVSPQQFKEFMATMDKAAEESEAELEKMRKMTPQELYQYQMKKQRALAFGQWVTFVIYCLMACSGTFTMYYMMYEWFVI